MISDDAEFAEWSKDTMELEQRVILHDASLVMTRLRPRIAEVEMNDAGDCVGNATA